MNFLAFLVYLPALVCSLQVNNLSLVERENAGSSSPRTTTPSNKQFNAARSMGVANLHFNSLTKLSPRNIRLVQKGTKSNEIQQDEAVPAPPNSAHPVLTKHNARHSEGLKARPRRQIRNMKGYEYLLIHKRAGEKIQAKNLLRTFIEDIHPDGAPEAAKHASPSKSESSHTNKQSKSTNQNNQQARLPAPEISTNP
ncbi:hypothetical protein PCANC_05848 [Puccinia coronata f. sp. avenae]|uniref:Uncharacterized protein n=1 Tax=Puccinia coronata f. sp. avenae TaxID=200324 RepID=A0A2N5SSU1_9BASI|nr:hypothetical protein PCANC_12995 [Puccinia coronata f. sp. avenae]PLW47380.1 hypothetical protein PCANC_05848 [Puccinia coronata f. sp. avenae]